jgi:Domain of unknown function (DUF4145)
MTVQIQNIFMPDNKNLFQTNGNFSDANNRPATTVRCPHCRQLGSFSSWRAIGFNKSGRFGANRVTQIYTAHIRICPNMVCQGIVFTIESSDGKIAEIEPPQLLDFNPDGLPENCLRTLKEAIACHAGGAYRAAAMMVRRLLEEICDANSAKGNNLHERLNSLKSIIVLPTDMFDAMFALKALGNDAAHIEAKEYNEIGRDEAEVSIELVKEILKALYQLKGLIARLKKQHAI